MEAGTELCKGPTEVRRIEGESIRGNQALIHGLRKDREDTYTVCSSGPPAFCNACIGI